MPDEEVELRLPHRRRRSPRRSGRSRSAGRRRSGSPRRTGRACRAARGGSRRGVCDALLSSRPTAVNLRWALDDDARATRRPSGRARIHDAEVEPLPSAWRPTPPISSRPGSRVLTHCNAGGLATGGYGTRARGDPRGVGAGARRARLGRRDAPAPPGSAADGVGARAAGHPARRDRRLRSGVADGAAARSTASSSAPTGSPRTATRPTRSAPTRSPCSRTTTRFRSTSSRRPRRSTARPPTGDGDPDRGARRRRGDARASPVITPPSTSRPAALIAAIVTERGVHRPPYEDVAAAMSVLDELPRRDGRRSLERYGFDAERFESLRARVARGELTPRPNVVEGVVEPPGARRPDHAARARHAMAWKPRAKPGSRPSRRAGSRRSCSPAAWRRGSAASSRARSRSLDGRSFLEWKLGETARLARRARRRDPGRADDELRHRRRDARPRRRARPAGAAVVLAVRLAAARPRRASCSGSEDGAPSLYGPGHGDLLEAIRVPRGRSPRCAREASRSCASRTSTTSARGSIPSSSGAHIAGGAARSRSRSRRQGGRHGRCAGTRRRPRRCCSRRRGSRRASTTTAIPVFNTNTALIDVDALEPAVRPDVALRREGRRRPDGGPARAALPRDHRRSSRRPIWSCRGAGRAVGSSRSRPRPISSARSDALREMLAASVLD